MADVAVHGITSELVQWAIQPQDWSYDSEDTALSIFCGERLCMSGQEGRQTRYAALDSGLQASTRS